MTAVVQTFRREDRSFLTPPPDVPLKPETRIDLSHESLMLRWSRLHTWLNEETESRRTYQRLAESAVLHREGKAGWLPRADLPPALDWISRQRPNQHWAQRYHPQFQLATAYLEKSRARAAASRRYKILTGTIALLAAVSTLSWWQSIQSTRALEKQRLEEAREQGELAGATANTQAKLRKAAEDAREKAQAASLDASTQRQLAVARQLSAQARAETGSPARSAMLALLSMGVHPSVEADNTIRQNLVLLPKRVLEARYPEEISTLSFLNTAGLLAIGGDNGVILLDARSGKQVAALLPKIPVQSLAASPDGAILAILAGSEARIWDVKQRRLRTVLAPARVTSISFSADSTRVAILTELGTFQIQDVSTGTVAAAGFDVGKVSSARISPDGRWLAVSGAAGLRILPVSGGAPVQFPGGDYLAMELEWSPDGSHVAVRTFGGGFYVAAAARGEWRSGFNQTARVTAAAFSHDSSRLVTGDGNGVVRMWQVSSAAVLWSSSPLPDQVTSVTFADGDKSVVTTCGDGATRIFAADSGAFQTVIESDTLSPRDVRRAMRPRTKSRSDQDAEDRPVATIADVGPDRLIATSRYGFDGKLRIWDRSAPAGALFFAAIPNAPSSIAYTPDGSRIALTFLPGRVQLLDARTGALGHSFETSGQRLIEIDSSDRNLVVTTVAGVALVPFGKTIPTVQIDDPSSVLAVRLTSGGKGLVWVEYGGTVKRWPAMSPGRFTAADGLGPDCYRNPAAIKDESILRLARTGSSWQPGCEVPKRGRRPSDDLPPAGLRIQHAALSAGGRDLAYAEAGSISLVNLDRPQARTVLTRKGVLTALAISDDGKQVAAATDKTVQVWNADGAEALKVDATGVLGLAFSPDRRYLVVAKSGQISAWYLRQPDMIADVCARLTRNLQPDEWQSIGAPPQQKLCKDLP